MAILPIVELIGVKLISTSADGRKRQYAVTYRDEYDRLRSQAIHAHKGEGGYFHRDPDTLIMIGPFKEFSNKPK